jgi:uncharacterized protein
MTSITSSPYCAFWGVRRLAEGNLPDIARAAVTAQATLSHETLLVFDSEGRQVELDLRGTPDEAAARAAASTNVTAVATPANPLTRSRGRPQLGVVAREVTLLPRHWEWLAAQPGGASATLRKLVEEARRQAGGNSARQAQERAYRFLNAIGGNLPGYESALRALFSGDAQQFSEALQAWPEDIRSHAHALAAGAFDNERKT